MSERKSEFWWASIYGADPEPVEKTERNGRPCVYTIGCADPFYLDDAGAVVFVEERMTRPPGPVEAKLSADDWQAQRDAARKGLKTYLSPYGGRRRVSEWAHGWRGPR